MGKGNGTRVSIAILATKLDAMHETMKTGFGQLDKKISDVEKQHSEDNSSMEKRVRKLEDFKIHLVGLVTGISAAITAVGQWVAHNLFGR